MNQSFVVKRKEDRMHIKYRDVLALAKDMNIKYIICDNKKAVNASKVIGLKYITALNVIVAMCIKGKISKEEAEKQIDILDEFGWYNIKLIKKASWQPALQKDRL